MYTDLTEVNCTLSVMQASQQHRLQCGPVHINLGGGGGSPERDARPISGPSASPAQLRARVSRRRSACFGLVEADDEEAAHSAVEQRYLKVCTDARTCKVCTCSHWVFMILSGHPLP